MTNRSPFRYFKTSPEIIRLAVMLCIRFPLSLPNVDDLLHKRGIEISHETVRYWWNRFGPMLPHRSTRAWLALFAFSLGTTNKHALISRESWMPDPSPPPISDIEHGDGPFLGYFFFAVQRGLAKATALWRLVWQHKSVSKHLASLSERPLPSEGRIQKGT
jgi:hypothetical protein